MEGAESLPVGPVASSECLEWSDLSQKAAAYASERLMIRAAEDVEAKMRVKMESLQKQVEDYRAKYGALERSHEELKTLHHACKANLEQSVANQKRQYEELISRLKEQVTRLEKAAARIADLEKQTHEQKTACESLRVQNTALREELERLVETQNDKQAQTSKEKAALREEAGRQQARALDLETKNEHLTRQLDKLKKEVSEVTLERERFGKAVTSEMDQIRQQAQEATEKAQASEKKALEKAESLRVQLEQIQADATTKLQRMKDLLARQTQQLSSAEEDLRRRRRELEERFSKLKRETDDHIATQDEEKRRALAEAMQKIQALKQEEQMKSAQVQELQEKCESLARQRASAQAKCDELTRRAEGVQADCERRVGEFDRLQTDFAALEESYRSLLAEMETLTTAKEEASAKLLSLQKELDLRQLQAAKLKEANQELQAKVTQAETAGEQLLRRLHHTVTGSQRMKHAVRQKLEAAKKTEDELTATVTMLRNRVSEVTAERNGLWQAVLKLKSGPRQGDEVTFDSSAQSCSSTFAGGAGFPTSQSNNQQGYPPNNIKHAAYNGQSTCPEIIPVLTAPTRPVCPKSGSSESLFNMPADMSGTSASHEGYAKGSAPNADDSRNRLWDDVEDDLIMSLCEPGPPYVAASPGGTNFPEYTGDFKRPE